MITLWNTGNKALDASNMAGVNIPKRSTEQCGQHNYPILVKEPPKTKKKSCGPSTRWCLAPRRLDRGGGSEQVPFFKALGGEERGRVNHPNFFGIRGGGLHPSRRTFDNIMQGQNMRKYAQKNMRNPKNHGWARNPYLTTHAFLLQNMMTFLIRKRC
jgi:hypothetical protein